MTRNEMAMRRQAAAGELELTRRIALAAPGTMGTVAVKSFVAGAVKRMARQYGVSAKSIYEWIHRAETGTLGLRRATGKPRRVKYELLAEVYRPGMSGRAFQAAVWDRFGVGYQKDHCYRIMARLRAELARKAGAGQ